MGNYLKMPDKRRVLALLELGWSYRRIERETGVRRETVARYDPRRQSKAANLSTGAESTSEELADQAYSNYDAVDSRVAKYSRSSWWMKM